MFDAISRSWNLMKDSLKVLRQEPVLAVFPIIAFVASVVLAGVLGGIGGALGWFSGADGVAPAGWLFIALFYFGAYFVAIYCQVALVAAVKERLAGGDPSLGSGIREANKRLGAIISWAIIAAIVGLILRILSEIARRNTRGWGRVVSQVIIGLVGAAWSLAVFFVIPIIAYEGVGGFAAIKRSVGIVKKQWGEAVIGNAGISLVTVIAAVIVGLVFGGIGILLISAGGTAAVAIGIAFVVAAMLGIATLLAVGSALQSIYTAVLYQYATTGTAPAYFADKDLRSAFMPAPVTTPGVSGS